jgi:RNA polymerase sigma factor (sigma-70 family)
MTAAIDLDTQLMIGVQRDDASSFSELLNRNRNLVVNYLSRMVVNRAIAEELAQDVFIRVYRSRRTYEPTAKFSTWLYRITTNVALNHFRDEKRTQSQISLDVQDALQVRREAQDCSLLIEDRLVRDVVAPDPARHSGVAAETARRRDHAQVRRDGLRADLTHSGLFSLGGKSADVQSV